MRGEVREVREPTRHKTRGVQGRRARRACYLADSFESHFSQTVIAIYRFFLWVMKCLQLNRIFVK